MSSCELKPLPFFPEIVQIHDCPKTWDMICDGNTLGCFQLESYLGQKLASQCKPRNIQELAELISVMRPGCLEAVMEDTGSTVTNHYIKRKAKLEEVTYEVQELEPILKETYGLLLYQEQAMKIATDIAGFSMVEADTLRKSIGKKDVALMASLKDKFVEGATRQIGKSSAEKIFEGIEKSQRYSFNKSHAVGYAQNCYISAYTKFHFTKSFFEKYLNFAKDFIEVSQLINNARQMGIVVLPPDLRKKNVFFKTIKGKICYGLANIKGTSESKLEDLLKEEIPTTWNEFLIHRSSLTDSTTIDALIKSGAIDFYNLPRELMLYEYKQFRKLPDTTRTYIVKNYTDKSLTSILLEIVDEPTGKGRPVYNKTSKKKVEQIIKDMVAPPFSLLDNSTIVGKYEMDLLGVSFSRTELDDCEIGIANMDCKGFNEGKSGINGVIILAINIKQIKEAKTKRGANPGQTMCFLSGYDESAEIDGIVVFPDAYSEHSHLLFFGNTVMLKGKRQRGSFLVEKIWQI